MYEQAVLGDYDKAYCMLKMFYEEIPEDIEQAFKKAIEFLDCGNVEENKTTNNNKKDYGRLWNWEQDGNYIYSAINYSHNDILKKNNNLHWWEFMNYFMQLKEDCQYNHIVSNRLAFKKGKMTDEQKTERKEYPEIYVLKEQRKVDDEKVRKAKEMQDKLNS